MVTSPACFHQRLDRRLESVLSALALAHQQLSIDRDLIDDEATTALGEILERARNDARIVSDALPAEVGAVALPDDYQGPQLPTVAMGGRRSAQRIDRRRKSKAE